MDYAHAQSIFANSDSDPVKQWVEAQNKPYTTLMRGYFSSKRVKNYLEEKGFGNYSALVEHSRGSFEFQVDALSSFITSDALTPAQRSDFLAAFSKVTGNTLTSGSLTKGNLKAAFSKQCASKSVDDLELLRKEICEKLDANPLKRYRPPLHAVEGRLFALPPLSDKNESERYTTDWEKMIQVDKDLRKLGVPVIFPSDHTYDIKDEHDKVVDTGRQWWIFLPNTKPNLIHEGHAGGVPEPSAVVPDFDNAVTFLAYLVHKGLVTEKDIPPGDSVYGSPPFSKNMLKFAQSAKYQNKIRAGLGEPLVPEEKQSSQNRGSSLDI